MPKFVFFYFMKKEPERIQKVAPEHVGYWKNSGLQGVIKGGPFADKSGGLIIFEAGSLESATEIIREDPFVIEELLEQEWVMEWEGELITKRVI